MVPKAPPHGVSTRSSPRCQPPTSSRTCVEPSYDPQTAVDSIHLQLPEEPCPRCLDDAGFHQSTKKHCSVKDNVSKRGTGPEAMSPQMPVAYAPIIRDPMCLRTRIKPSYRPQMAVAYVHPRFHVESHCRCHLGTKLDQMDELHCSVKDSVSKQWTVPRALSPYMQVTNLRVTQGPTCLKTRARYSHSPKRVVSSNLPCLH